MEIFLREHKTANSYCSYYATYTFKSCSCLFKHTLTITLISNEWRLVTTSLQSQGSNRLPILALQVTPKYVNPNRIAN